MALHTLIRERGKYAPVEKLGVKMVFPPAGFQDLANEIQLEDKDSLLPFPHTLSLGGLHREPSAGLTGMFRAAGV